MSGGKHPSGRGSFRLRQCERTPALDIQVNLLDLERLSVRRAEQRMRQDYPGWGQGELIACTLTLVHARPGLIPVDDTVPVGLGANVRTIPTLLFRHNRWSRLAGKSGINHGICFVEHLPILPQISELSQWYLLIPSKPRVSLAARRRRGIERCHIGKARYGSSMLQAGIRSQRYWSRRERQGEMGCQRQRISSVKAPIVKSTYKKEWRRQKRLDVFAR